MRLKDIKTMEELKEFSCSSMFVTVQDEYPFDVITQDTTEWYSDNYSDDRVVLIVLLDNGQLKWRLLFTKTKNLTKISNEELFNDPDEAYAYQNKLRLEYLEQALKKAKEEQQKLAIRTTPNN